MSIPVMESQKLPLVANEILNNWTEKDVRWHNQPSVSGNVLDYKEVKQVQNGNTITITADRV